MIDLTARLLAGVLRELSGAEAVARVLRAVLPWVRFLPAGAVDELVQEFIDTTQAAAEINNVAR